MFTIPALIVVLPLVVAAIVGLVIKQRETRTKWVAFAGSLISLAIAVMLLLSPGGIESFNWFTISGYSFSITVSTQPLNMLLLMVVALITPLIFFYSFGFMDVPSEQQRFYFEMCIFAAAMMLFAISASFITMFIAWEALGITSYLLIGFWHYKDKPPTAARKAITTILIGDIAMLAAILIIGSSYHSFDFSAVLNSPPAPNLDLALVLILIAAFTKSAQFPFHEWLSDAMEGPTPVSAFLHSSTMVKAGVFLIAVLLPLYINAGLLWVILVFGMISAVLGVSNALTERHVKKILAYSTIEDMGLMFVALGLGSLVAAMVLFFVQAFYKALLFMSAGSVMKANDEKEDIYSIFFVPKNKFVFITLLIGALSLAGIFPLSGFFGKALVESAATNALVYAVLLLVGFASSIYIFRWLFVQMRSSYEEEINLGISYKSIPKSMIIPPYILSLCVGLASLGYFFIPSYLGGYYSIFMPITIYEYVATSAVALAGIGVAYYIFRKGKVPSITKNKALFKAFYNTRIVNAFYLYVTKAFTLVADALGYLDFAFDKATYALSDLFIDIGYSAKVVVNGQTNVYVLAFIFGFVLMVVTFLVVKA